MQIGPLICQEEISLVSVALTILCTEFLNVCQNAEYSCPAELLGTVRPSPSGISAGRNELQGSSPAAAIAGSCCGCSTRLPRDLGSCSGGTLLCTIWSIPN